MPGYRLPTEAEWEYACRAGTKGLFNADVDASKVLEDAAKGRFKTAHRELRKFASQKISAVGGGRLPNAWGLYDVHGNVAEWCLDTYAPYPEGEGSTDPVAFGAGTDKVIRGGSGKGGWELMRSASRYSVPFDIHYYAFVGMRLVLAPELNIPSPE